MMKKSVVVLVLALAPVAFGQFGPELDILVNNEPWDGGSVTVSDEIWLGFVEKGEVIAPGSFSVFELGIDPAGYLADSFVYHLPAGLLGGKLELTETATGLAIGGNAMYSPATPLPEGGLLFEVKFHVPELNYSDYIEIPLKGGYGAADTSGLTTRIHYVPEPMTIALLGLGGLALLRRRK
jgi:hypothetical protein